MEQILAHNFVLATRGSWGNIQEVYEQCRRYKDQSEVITCMTDEVLASMLCYDFAGITGFQQADYVFCRASSRELQEVALAMMEVNCVSKAEYDRYQLALCLHQSAIRLSEELEFWPDDWLLEESDD